MSIDFCLCIFWTRGSALFFSLWRKFIFKVHFVNIFYIEDRRGRGQLHLTIQIFTLKISFYLCSLSFFSLSLPPFLSSFFPPSWVISPMCPPASFPCQTKSLLQTNPFASKYWSISHSQFPPTVHSFNHLCVWVCCKALRLQLCATNNNKNPTYWDTQIPNP